MSGFVTRFASVLFLLVILPGPSSPLFRRPPVLTGPPDPIDHYYEAFKTVPAPSVTADKLLTNVLNIGQKKRSVRIEDYVIVMDGSHSIGSCEFEKDKKALSFLLGMPVPNTDRKYAAVTFSNSATVNFKFSTPSYAKKEIMKISYPDSWTNTQAGLAAAKKLFDDPYSGRRAYSRKTVLLVTDGQSNKQQSLTVPNANALKNAGVQIQVLAIGDFSNGIDEMVKVASTAGGFPPTPDNVLLYRVADYNGFLTIVKMMLKKHAPGTWAIVSGQYDTLCPQK
ncbi:hypothetical protein ACROYT_G006628 [Oculina patagonica]